MPGEALGAIAPALSLASNESTHAANVRPILTRTRRNHGVMTIGGQMAAVYSSRRAGACYGVRFELGGAQLTLAFDMTPAQARSLARSLVAAAASVEDTQGGAQ